MTARSGTDLRRRGAGLAFTGVLLAATTAHAADTVRVTFATQATGQTGWTCFTTRHLVAVWLEDDTTGTYVRTLRLFGQSFLPNLKDWARASDMVLDGVTGATQLCDTGKVADQNDANGDGCDCGTACSSTAMPSQLDTTAVDISDIPDGPYRVRLELSHCEIANSFDTPDTTIVFTKNGVSSTSTPVSQTGFMNVVIAYSANRGAGSPPGVNAGANQILAPSAAATRTTTLTGVATDDGGSPTVTWSQLSCDPPPGTATFADLHAASTSVSFSHAGRYLLQLAATDGTLTSTDEVTITVNARVLKPDADGAVDSVNTGRAFGSLLNDAAGARGHHGGAVGSDSQNRMRYYVRFDTGAVVKPVLKATLRLPAAWAPIGCTAPLAGHLRNVYVLTDAEDLFYEIDDDGAGPHAALTWANQPVVSSSNVRGMLDAGRLPVGQFNPNPEGTVTHIATWDETDVDLAATFAALSQQNGFLGFFVRPDPADTNPCTVEVMSRENYVAPELVVIEGWQAAPNTPPLAVAGSDQSVADPDGDGVQAVTVDGSGSSDADGTVTGYAWQEGSTTLASGAVARVTLALGVHDLTLTVSDNAGGTAQGGVQIIVDDRFAGNAVATSARALTGATAGTAFDNLMAYESFAAGARGDWFSVALPAGADLGVAAQLSNADGDLDLRLFQPDATTLITSSVTAGNTETVAASDVAAGTYLVNVSAARGLADANTYSMTVSVTGVPTLSVTLNPTAAPENAGTLSAAGLVTTDTSPLSDLIVNLTSDDAALTVPAQVTIGAGATSAPFDLSLLDNAVADGNRLATITASASGHGAGSSALTIVDDDGNAGPVVNWTQASQLVLEDAVAAAVRVSLSVAASQTIIIPYTVAGTATPGVDHSLADGSITIAAGQIVGAVGFTITYDTAAEGDETIVVTLGTPQNAVLGVTSVETVTIRDVGAGGDTDNPGADPAAADNVAHSAGCACRGQPGGLVALAVAGLALGRGRRRHRSIAAAPRR
ncbi:MAG: pre-peptidase C-terminal domain-containing protein [Deltaproteobacteria bacterium]|nr:pre-peptidase C-terminal domain-containing protein [Deltaproteobacteria bacterium]